MFFRFAFLFLSLLLSVSSQARVFTFSDESVAPYVNFRGGMSSMGADSYEWQSAGTYSGDEVDLVYGGEFGVYLKGGALGVSLGVLVQTFDPVTAAIGKNSSGVDLFQVDVEGLAYGPSLNFDYQLSSTPSYLWKFIVGGGYLFSKVENNYSFTSQGSALVSGQSQMTETYKNASAFATVAVETEFVMTGTTTLSFQLGYHHSFAKSWQYGQGGVNFAGNHAQGSDAVFEDGSVKNINWSYPYLQVGFHFYVDKVR